MGIREANSVGHENDRKEYNAFITSSHEAKLGLVFDKSGTIQEIRRLQANGDGILLFDLSNCNSRNPCPCFKNCHVGKNLTVIDFKVFGKDDIRFILNNNSGICCHRKSNICQVFRIDFKGENKTEIVIMDNFSLPVTDKRSPVYQTVNSYQRGKLSFSKALPHTIEIPLIKTRHEIIFKNFSMNRFFNEIHPLKGSKDKKITNAHQEILWDKFAEIVTHGELTDDHFDYIANFGSIPSPPSIMDHVLAITSGNEEAEEELVPSGPSPTPSEVRFELIENSVSETQASLKTLETKIDSLIESFEVKPRARRSVSQSGPSQPAVSSSAASGNGTGAGANAGAGTNANPKAELPVTVEEEEEPTLIKISTPSGVTIPKFSGETKLPVETWTKIVRRCFFSRKYH